MTIAEIRELIAKNKIEPDTDNWLFEGKLDNSLSQSETYRVYHNLDIIRANLCDKLWGSFNLRLIEFIKAQNYDEEELKKVEESVLLEDFHWDWLKKSTYYNSDEYDWFFLDINKKPQAVCLIYHPKKSFIGPGDIFYIEYIAVAPWNRPNPMKEKQYCGVGSEILKCVIEYAIVNLRLRPGFSLHSLHKAEGFYEKIGMTCIDAHKKETMKYYEMSKEATKKFLGKL